MCSSNGIYVNHQCLCDAGWTGLDCNLKTTFSDVSRKSLLIVTDSFGYPDADKWDSLALSNLALYLLESEYSVSVLFLGKSKQFQALKKMYAGKIEFHTPIELGFKFGRNSVLLSKSYLTFRFLIENNQFENVLFHSPLGVAFSTLTARRQGLFYSKAKFLFLFDKSPSLFAERIIRKDPSYASINVELLKEEYMTLKCLEMTVFSD